MPLSECCIPLTVDIITPLFNFVNPFYEIFFMFLFVFFIKHDIIKKNKERGAPMIMTSSPAEIGQRIRNIRRSKEMTQEELGKRLGVTKATINKYEAGQVNFPRNRIEQLSKALLVSPSYLLGWDDCKDGVYVETLKNRGSLDPGSPDYEIIKGLAGEGKNKMTDTTLAELERIYSGLSIKDRTRLLMFAYELEDKKCEQ